MTSGLRPEDLDEALRQAQTQKAQGASPKRDPKWRNPNIRPDGRERAIQDIPPAVLQGMVEEWPYLDAQTQAEARRRLAGLMPTSQRFKDFVKATGVHGDALLQKTDESSRLEKGFREAVGIPQQEGRVGLSEEFRGQAEQAFGVDPGRSRADLARGRRQTGDAMRGRMWDMAYPPPKPIKPKFIQNRENYVAAMRGAHGVPTGGDAGWAWTTDRPSIVHSPHGEMESEQQAWEEQNLKASDPVLGGPKALTRLNWDSALRRMGQRETYGQRRDPKTWVEDMLGPGELGWSPEGHGAITRELGPGYLIAEQPNSIPAPRTATQRPMLPGVGPMPARGVTEPGWPIEGNVRRIQQDPAQGWMDVLFGTRRR